MGAERPYHHVIVGGKSALGEFLEMLSLRDIERNIPQRTSHSMKLRKTTVSELALAASELIRERFLYAANRWNKNELSVSQDFDS
jgi:hypothetical protein